MTVLRDETFFFSPPPSATGGRSHTVPAPATRLHFSESLRHPLKPLHR